MRAAWTIATQPADHAAVLATWGVTECRPAGDHLQLTYERLGDSRFRLTIDPASPAPNFDDASRMPLRSKAAGTPASRAPMVWEHSRVIELPVTEMGNRP